MKLTDYLCSTNFYIKGRKDAVLGYYKDNYSSYIKDKIYSILIL